MKFTKSVNPVANNYYGPYHGSIVHNNNNVATFVTQSSGGANILLDVWNCLKSELLSNSKSISNLIGVVKFLFSVDNVEDKIIILEWSTPSFKEENTIFSYKCTQLYSLQNEVTVMWNDPKLTIDWGLDNPIVSEKDGLGLDFTTFASPF